MHLAYIIQNAYHVRLRVLLAIPFLDALKVERGMQLAETRPHKFQTVIVIVNHFLKTGIALKI